MTPQDLGLPQKEFWPHQLWALSALAELDTTVTLLDAPTGSGKTLLGAAWARIHDRPLLYTCETKTLQTQFLGDFPDAVQVLGRANYPTLDYPQEFPEINCGDCTRKTKKASCQWCSNTDQCPYTIARDTALGVDQVALNLAYWLKAANTGGSAWSYGGTDQPYTNRCWNCQAEVSSQHCPKCRTCGWLQCPSCGKCERGCSGGPYDPVRQRGRYIVIDEADMLESILLDQLSVQIPVARLQVGHPITKNPTRKDGKRADWVPWMNVVSQAIEQRINTTKERAEGSTGAQYAKAMRTVDYYEEMNRSLLLVRSDLEAGSDEWVQQQDKDYVSFKPIRLRADRAKAVLWRHGQRFLLMSGTFVSHEAICSDLCLNPSEVGWVSVPGTYPAENRRVFYYPTTTASTYKNKDVAWVETANRMDEILQAYPERVLVHGHSYALCRYLATASDFSRRILVHDSAKGRDKALEEYRATPGAVLITPSLERGISLAGDQCRCVIVAKVPFPSLQDAQVAARLHTQGGQLWYTITTIRTVIQQVGRLVRSIDDWGDAWIIDASFGRILRVVVQLCPYVAEALETDMALIRSRLRRVS